MGWLWATASRSGPAVTVRLDLAGAAAGFVNGGTEPELWGRGYPAGPDLDRLAAGEFVATARAAAAAVRQAGSPNVEVLGDGLLGQLVRAELPAGSSAPPEIVVDTTGSPARIQAAVSSLPRLGQLILAAPVRPASIALASYADLHVRGLTLLGIGWARPPASVASPGAGSADRSAVEAALGSIRRARSGVPSPASPLYAIYPMETPCQP